eukprot:scaffold1872_cov268-Chaetoceros_neogracile.AAC.18
MPETLAYEFHQENLEALRTLLAADYSTFCPAVSLKKKTSPTENSRIISSGRSTDGGRRQCRDINDMALLETAVQAVTTVIKEEDGIDNLPPSHNDSAVSE